MKLKILYLILFILIFMPIGLCEIINNDINLNNTKIYDKNDKIVSIYDKNSDKSMDIKLISTISDIDKLIKIVEITNYIEYIPNKENDFITKTKKVYGKNDVYKIEYFIEKYNYTFENIIINKTIFNNKTSKNETKLINKSIVKDINSFWVKFKPYNKQMFKNETFKLKIIHYKKPELGFFKIQTIPIFKNIECKEFTWWDGNWNLKRPILINNINGDNVRNYQLKSVNLSQYQINASSARIINESSGLIQSHWNESIDFNGNLEFVWCNFSKINNTWVNNTYYIYYQSIPIVNSYSNITKTFIFGDDIDDGTLNKWVVSGNAVVTSLEYVTPLYSAYLPASTTGVIQGTHINQTGTYINEFDMRYTVDSIYFAIYVYNNTIIGTDIEIYNGQLQYYDGTYHIIYNTEINTWYHIKQIINITSNTFDIYVDDMNNPKVINANFRNSISKANSIKFRASNNINGYIDNNIIRKYTLNEPELWTVGDIEYPEGINMTCNLKIITHLTNKKVQVVDMNASIVNESYTNECINLSYDSYIVYMSNPVKISSFTGLLNILDNFLVQFLLFIFLIIIATLFYVFIQIVKKKGFKL